jgi:methionyl-tRNA synthetase
MSSDLVGPGGPLFVTATPPTPNGDLHLGHFSGPYLAADVFARHQRQLRDGVVIATGIDDNQSYTDLRAGRDGVTAPETAEYFGDRIEQAWRTLGVRWDVVSRPRRSAYHRPLVEQFVTTLYATGQLVARRRPLPWCPQCETWAYEAYVRGRCPHCGTDACGNACEVCCRPNDCADLRDPECNRCGAPARLRECERLYFPLEPHRATLEKFWSEVAMNPHLATVCDQMSAAGLPEIAVSHPSPWGIPVPLPGFESHTVYVWFEMAAGYLATAAECAGSGGDWRRFWQDGSVVQFFGIDNGYFHAILFPALMTAFDARIGLPKAFVGNEFYRLEGQKFSTSRRHAIWISDAVARANPDHLRLYLCLDRPAATQTSFSWPQLRARLTDDVLSRWARWLADAQHRFTLAAGVAGPGNPRPEPVITALLAQVDEAYSVARFSPRRAVALLDLIATEGAEQGALGEYYADSVTLRSRLAETADAEACALTAFAAGLAPVAPTLAEELWAALRLPGTAAGTRWCDVPALAPRWREVADLPERCPALAGVR